ncbi:MAG: HAD hydrolase family protein [Kouleothrix sp.]
MRGRLILKRSPPTNYSPLDLDGTVLDAQLQLAPEVATAIAAAQARGVYVTIATGRMFRLDHPQFARQLNIDGPLICFQGALIRDSRDGAISYHVPTPADLAAEAIELLHAAGLFVLAYIDEAPVGPCVRAPNSTCTSAGTPSGG